ncbi:hypothetical protein FIBSPDRAFT_951356 [Athelia psychrophila]|uniref:Uncharacterized protein n=1 Tax=Athelia psychrophila TaxID=1759441 RepID=A0A166MU59_9AGAM|nr:hypothetical protein FIBSPDRAFT_951356 [Fibularhizoctonia sp. CBS 109695]
MSRHRTFKLASGRRSARQQLPQSHGPQVHLAAPALCCPTHDLAAFSLAFVARAAAACPHLLAVIALSARATPAFLPLLHPPAQNGKQIAISLIPAHDFHIAFEDTRARR